MKTFLFQIVSGLFLLALAGFITNGCSTPISWTENSGAKTEDLAKFSGDWNPNYKVYIIKADGKPMRTSPLFGRTQTVYLNPGQHVLFVGYESFQGLHAFQTVRLAAEPGKSYAIHRKLEGYKVMFSVEDIGKERPIQNHQNQITP